MHVFAVKHGIPLGRLEAAGKENVRQLFEELKARNVRTLGVEHLLRPWEPHDPNDPINRYWLEVHRLAEENNITLVDLKTTEMKALTYVEDILDVAREHGVGDRKQWDGFRREFLSGAAPQNEEGEKALKAIEKMLDEIERINPAMHPEFNEKLSGALSVRETYALHSQGQERNMDGVLVGTGHGLHLKALERIEPVCIPKTMDESEVRALTAQVLREVRAHRELSEATKTLLEIAAKAVNEKRGG